ncbi:MAG TPA: hypothetical protein VE224_02575 [Pseudolabrys sp.]|jgi:hypothetical protein|nr:hypothetical protein [Pseudolabrys sp.]
MRRGWQKCVTVLALYAVALHVILLGLSPVNAGDFGPINPFAVICHTIGAAAESGESPQGTVKYLPGRAIDFCNLCGAAAPPPAPDGAFHVSFRPARVLHVLRPISMPATAGLSCDPKLIRGPPLAAS